jgi:hypothetical protein
VLDRSENTADHAGLPAAVGRISSWSRFGPDLVAIGVGLLAFLVIFGPRFFFLRVPFLTMPMGDVAAEMAGYFHFAQDAWRLPLFDLPNINQPEGANQLFIGGVPVLALLAKIVHTLTGSTPNLFGAWYLLCCVLQAHSLFYLMRQITDERPYLLALASVTGLLCFAFMTRFGHVSLCAQFLNIYAMGLVIATTKPNADARSILLRSALLTFVAMFVFAYLAIANTVLFGAALASLWWLRRISIRGVLIAGIGLVVSLLALSAIGGYFWAVGRAAPQDISSYAALGLNLGSLFIPPMSVLFPGNQLFYAWWEGNFYLGAGILVLWFAIFMANPMSVVEATKRNWPIALILTALLVYCVSNRVSLGNTILFEYHLPKFMVPIVGMARSAGRLFWPIGYLLIAAAFALTVRQYPRKAPQLVVVALLLSCLETTGTYAFLQDKVRVAPPAVVDYVGLQQVLNQHKKMLVYPSFWCDAGGDESEKRRLHWQLEYTAARANLSSNSAITARQIKDCGRESREMAPPRSDEIAIFTTATAARTALGSSQDATKHCRTFKLDQHAGFMCSSSWSEETILPIAQLTPPLPLETSIAGGGVIDFSEGSNASQFMSDGWSKDAEGPFRWTSGGASSVIFKLPKEKSETFSIEVIAFPFLHPPEIKTRDVDVLVNGSPAASWKFTTGSWTSNQFELPPGLEGKEVSITFRQGEVRSPAEVGSGSDARQIGLAVKTITLLPIGR